MQSAWNIGWGLTQLTTIIMQMWKAIKARSQIDQQAVKTARPDKYLIYQTKF